MLHFLQSRHKRVRINLPAVFSHQKSQNLSENVLSCKKKIKLLQQSKRRLKKRNAELKYVISELKQKDLLSSGGLDILEKCAGGVSHLLKRNVAKLQNVPVPTKYSPELRSFALTLYFYSPAAYRYVRKSFDTCLPHPKTVSKWYKNVDGKPGFTNSAFTILKNRVQSPDSRGIPVPCNLVMDEIAIRKHLEWDGTKYHGYIDMGTELDDDTLPVVTEALTFMAVGLKEYWKLPIGYFLIDGMSGIERKNLVNTCLEKLNDIGITIVSLILDGSSPNIAMIKELGVSIDARSGIRSHFPHPVTGEPVSIFLDPCHMLKLVRNTLAEKKSICVGEDVIKWDYIDALHHLQQEENLHLGNKLRTSHILWFKKKMNVKLAAQTLSESVASSLEFCLAEDIQAFRGCEATIKLLRLFNSLFDILNSRNFKSCGWKAPLQNSNREKMFNFLTEAKAYILSLTESRNGLPLVAGRRKNGFIGFLLCIDSVISIFDRLVLSDVHGLKFLLTYKFSQDHLELFFGKIRSMGGFNNNPSARQFTTAYTRLLTHNEVQHVLRGNCLPLESVPILTVSSRGKVCPHTNQETTTVDVINSSFSKNRILVSENSDDDSHDDQYVINYAQLSSCAEKIVAYIAGFVVCKLKKSINCEMCCNALTEEDLNLSPIHSLITMKSRGGLSIPSKDVIEICIICEKHFRKFVASGADGRVSNVHCHNLLQSIMKSFIKKPLFPLHSAHMMDQEGFNNHLVLLLKAIAEKYLQVRYFYAGKIYSATIKEKMKFKTRQTLNKLIIFSGQ